MDDTGVARVADGAETVVAGTAGAGTGGVVVTEGTDTVGVFAVGVVTDGTDTVGVVTVGVVTDGTDTVGVVAVGVVTEGTDTVGTIAEGGGSEGTGAMIADARMPSGCATATPAIPPAETSTAPQTTNTTGDVPPRIQSYVPGIVFAKPPRSS